MANKENTPDADDTYSSDTESVYSDRGEALISMRSIVTKEF